MKPRLRQFLSARVTVVRDVLARLASSSCDNGGVIRWITPFMPLAVPLGEMEQERG